MQNKEDRKLRIEHLKRRVKPEPRVNSLLEECWIALGNEVQIYGEYESGRLFKVLEQTFPFTSWGYVDCKFGSAIIILNFESTVH